MARFNTKEQPTKTINMAGGESYSESPELELASILLTSFAQDQYYRSADDTLTRVRALIEGLPDKTFAAKVAVYARNELGMRSITHAVAGEIARLVHGEKWTRTFFSKIVHRPDDMMEILAYCYNKCGMKTEPNALKKGFADALGRFDAYALAKYRGEGNAVSLVDVVNLVHPKPTEKNRDALSALIGGTLKSTDTWEAKLTEAGKSAESDEDKAAAKAEAWAEMVKSRKIGFMALLRNLRNILQCAPDVVDAACEMLVDEKLIRKSLVMPFRFNTAYEVIGARGDGGKVLSAISEALDKSLANVPELPGKTLVVLDDSGSMDGQPIRIGSLFAAALYKAMDADFLRFSNDASYRSFDRRDTAMSIARQIVSGMAFGGTNFPSIFERANRGYDRIIILSDMQGWMGCHTPAKAFAAYKSQHGCNPHVYSFDLAGYGTLQFPEPNVYCLAGMSDKVFDLMKLLETDRQALVNTIKAIEL